MPDRFAIQVYNQISERGLSRLPASAYHVGKDVADADHMVAAVRDRRLDDLDGLRRRVGRAVDAADQQARYAERLLGCRDACDHAVDHRRIVDAVGIEVVRVEEELDVPEIAVAHRVLDILVDGARKVFGRAQRQRRQAQHIEEAVEVGPLIELVGRPRQGEPGAPGELGHRGGAQGAGQVAMQLGLGNAPEVVVGNRLGHRRSHFLSML